MPSTPVGLRNYSAQPYFKHGDLTVSKGLTNVHREELELSVAR